MGLDQISLLLTSPVPFGNKLRIFFNPKILMDLTDEQWALIQPIITSDKYLSREGTDPDRVASERGRGPIPNPSQLPACTRDERPVLCEAKGPGERSYILNKVMGEGFTL